MDPIPNSSSAPTLEPYDSAQLANVVAAVRDLQHPTRIGPFDILELIGEGGMGSVYKAEQYSPIHRIVAIKVIKLGMDTREVIARFESERQALAVLDHPHIAKVLDAGATESGRPYFIMEYVHGESITTFADRHRLTLRQRLELFIQACDAVQHAHQKAIIHRDLKPSNILVTTHDGKPWVKVIDFGVAKAIDQRLTEKTLFTAVGQLLGTPEYMSPEQADPTSPDVDTRSDVYSLGVVLYELLSGAQPFDAASLRSAGYQEIQRIIREVDPPRPSTRFSRLGLAGQEIAHLRQIQRDALARQLKSELEWIPLKAMRKDRGQRYATATELAQDIDNYLANRPLGAGPESASYRARKFLRRNKRGVIAAASMAALLVAGVITTSWQAIRATRAQRLALAEKQEADRQREQAVIASQNLQEVNRFLTDDLLASASPEIARGREMTVREALDRAAETVAGRFPGRPLTEAAVRAVLADTYDALGYTDRGLPHARAALDIIRRERGNDDEQTLIAAHEVGRELANLDRHTEAEPMLRDVYERSRRLLGEEHAVTLTALGSLAMTLRMQERFAEAEPLYRRALDGDRRTHGPQSEQVATSLNNLAVLLNTQKRASEAEPLYREALEIKRKLLGEDHPSYLGSIVNLARVLQDQGNLAEAEAMFRQALREKRRVLKDDHPSTTLTMNDLAVLLAQQRRFDEAEALHREALAGRRRVLGENDNDTLQSMQNLGWLLNQRGKYAEAESLIRQALEKRRMVLGELHPHTLNSISALAGVYESQQRFADAEPLLASLLQPDRLERLTAVQQAIVMARYGCCLAELNKLPQAEPILLDARRRLLVFQPAGTARLRDVLEALASLCQRTNRPEEASRWQAELASLPPATQPAADPATRPASAPAAP